MTRRHLALALVALMTAILLAPAQASAQFSAPDDDLRMYMNPRTQQGIIVTILPSTGMDPAILLGMVDDDFVEANMEGFTVQASETITPLALSEIQADAGKLFGIRDASGTDAILMVLADDGDMIMLAYIGFDTEADFEVAARFARDVCVQGITARPPSGFSPMN